MLSYSGACKTWCWDRWVCPFCSVSKTLSSFSYPSLPPSSAQFIVIRKVDVVLYLIPALQLVLCFEKEDDKKRILWFGLNCSHSYQLSCGSPTQAWCFPSQFFIRSKYTTRVGNGYPVMCEPSTKGILVQPRGAADNLILLFVVFVAVAGYQALG